MEENSSLAYAEVYEILNLIEDEYIKRIPKNIINFFEEERDKEYNPIIDVNIPLEQQNLRRQTIVLLAILNYNYWCDSEEEKEKIHEELITNNEIREKELAEKYNPDNMFKKKNEVKEQTTVDAPNIQLVEYKEQGFIKKLLNKLMRLFKK